MDNEQRVASVPDDKLDKDQVDYVEEDLKLDATGKVDKYVQHAIYQEALDRYPTDESIDQIAERKVIRKLDRRILPLLGVCYFFYVCLNPNTFYKSTVLQYILTYPKYVDKTTLSYAAIFGIKEGLNLKNEEYSWLSSSFYFGWLIWAIPSNLIMQRCLPAYYLSFNIFMWGVLLMAQAGAQNFAGLTALRILSGAAVSSHRFNSFFLTCLLL